MSSKTETKEAFPKIEPVAPHNPFGAFDPLATWTATQQTWQKMMSDAYGRAQAWGEEYAQFEAQMFARTRTAIDTWAQLARDTVTYSEQLTAQARKLGFEVVRKASTGA